MKFGLMFLLFEFPLMVLLGLVLPVASIVSFLRSFRETAPNALAHPRVLLRLLTERGRAGEHLEHPPA